MLYYVRHYNMIMISNQWLPRNTATPFTNRSALKLGVHHLKVNFIIVNYTVFVRQCGLLNPSAIKVNYHV